jgi:single-stranded DNA-specific DHH superfamily exonuclease
MAKDRHRDIRGAVFSTLDYNFGGIPMDEGLALLSNGLEDRAAYVRLYAAECVKFNIDHLPVSLILKALEVHRELCNFSNWSISYFATLSFDNFEELAQKKFEKEKCIKNAR